VHVPSTVAVPFGQKHVALFSREIMPLVHGMQSPELVVTKFALQKHAALPGTDVLVLLQLSHAASPLAFLNVPAAHAAHGPPSGPVVPAGHTQPAV
jgi:hypothetical protein